MSHTDQPDLSSLAPAGSLARSIALLARLRGEDGCPWDRVQTFDSIRRHTLEETYEVFDAIDRRDWPNLRDELGDLLLQVLFYARMAEEAGYFAFADVAEGLNAKLVRRHPHIFADEQASTPNEVNALWEAAKRKEKPSAADAGLLAGVSTAQPAFLEAHKLGQRAQTVGFDWPTAAPVLDKLHEELEELRAELTAPQFSAARAEAELGDLLFTATQLARHLALSPEFALRGANRRFRSRIGTMESFLEPGTSLATLAPEGLERLWSRAKAIERTHPAAESPEVS